MKMDLWDRDIIKRVIVDIPEEDILYIKDNLVAFNQLEARNGKALHLNTQNYGPIMLGLYDPGRRLCEVTNLKSADFIFDELERLGVKTDKYSARLYSSLAPDSFGKSAVLLALQNVSIAIKDGSFVEENLRKFWAALKIAGLYDSVVYIKSVEDEL